MLINLGAYKELTLYFDDELICLGTLQDLAKQATKVHCRRSFVLPKGFKYVGISLEKIKSSSIEQPTVCEVNTFLGY